LRRIVPITDYSDVFDINVLKDNSAVHKMSENDALTEPILWNGLSGIISMNKQEIL
jgi:hypothetical protein